jgi:hypothetical protein
MAPTVFGVLSICQMEDPLPGIFWGFFWIRQMEDPLPGINQAAHRLQRPPVPTFLDVSLDPLPAPIGTVTLSTVTRSTSYQLQSGLVPLEQLHGLHGLHRNSCRVAWSHRNSCIPCPAARVAIAGSMCSWQYFPKAKNKQGEIDPIWHAQ